MKRFCIFHRYKFTGYHLDAFNQKRLFVWFRCTKCGKERVKCFEGE